MKFLFLGKPNDNPSTRYRIQPVAQKLADADHEVEVASSDIGFFAKLWLLYRAKQFDTVFIQRKLYSPWLVKSLASRAERLVFDYDDAIYLKSSGEPSKQRQTRFQAVCENADLIIAGNQHLAAQAKEYTSTVEVVPTSVDIDRYASNATNREIKPTLVWIGSRSTRRYLDLLTPVLEALGTWLPELRLKVIADFEFHCENLEVLNVAWSNEREISEISACHVGIAPMVNNGWTRGKCALKVIQYMAAGLPVVSDRCGANQEVVVEGETGYLADNEQDWIEAIARLIEDAELAAKLGAAGRSRARTDYSKQVLVEKTARLLL